MSVHPYSYSKMEPTLGSSVCLLCFQITNHMLEPLDTPEKLLTNCEKYLHSTLTKGTLKDVELHNKNQVPLCRRCFDSAFELTQLSEQLTTIQKDISDLTVAFSMTVFHRRSQAYSVGQSSKTSSIIEFNEMCLPPDLFLMKLGDQNTHPNKKNREMDINGFHLQTDISNVKCEATDIEFENPQLSVANDDIEMQFNNDNLHKQCEESTIEQNQNLASVSEMRISHRTGTKNVDHKFDTSVVNSNQTNCESRQKQLNETLFKDDELSANYIAPKSPGGEHLLKCFYSENKNTFVQEFNRIMHHKTHNGDQLDKGHLGKHKSVYRNNEKTFRITPIGKKILYKCGFCEKEFLRPSKLKIHERHHTGEKPFKCSFCNFRFSNKSNLYRHERTHTREKPFKSSFCGQSFSDKFNLKPQETLHTGEKPHKSLYSEKTFSRRIDKNSHQKFHREQMSSLISQVDTQKDRSLGHLKHQEHIHSAVLMEFKCSFCEMAFSDDEERANHENIHNITEDEIVNANLIIGI